MAHTRYDGIGKKGQAKFMLYYDGPKKPDGSRNQLTESFSVHPLPEKASGIINAEKKRKAGTANKTELLLLERFERQASELADLEAANKEKDIHNPNYIQPVEVNKEPFTKHSARWLEYKAGTARKGKRQPKTLWRYEQLLERINEFFEDDWVEDIDIDRVEEFYAWLAVQKKKKGNGQKNEPTETLSSQSQWHYHRCLYSIIEYAVARGKLPSNPCRHVRPHEAPDSDEKKPDSYTAEEATEIRLLLEQEPLKRRVFAQIALEIGARPEEIHGLKWADIDFKKRLIDFNKVWQYVPGEGSFEKPFLKNKHSRRKVKVSAATIFLLLQLKSEQKSDEEKAGDKWIGSQAVFADWQGKQLAATWAGDWWSKWIKTTGLPIKTLYCLRHTCISLLIAAGANPLEVARMVGHANVEMLWRVYGHAVEKENFAGADIMESLTRKNQQESELI